MSWKKIAIASVLFDFSALTAYAVYEVGYVGFFEILFSNIVGITVGVDLFIALGLALAWMIRDARAHDISPTPYVVLTLAFGSVGPLAYLLRRPEEAAVPAATTAHAQRINREYA